MTQVEGMKASPSRFPQSRKDDFPYFRRLWSSVVAALLVASLIPLVLIGGGMYYYAVSALKERTLDTLRMEITDHKKEIDRFLSERTVDLQLLAETLGLKGLSEPGALERVFSFLQKARPCFTDLGVIDDRGRHLAYVGPFALISKNYANEAWFRAVMKDGIYVSDVYAGFRNSPHFIIAIRREDQGAIRILRATVDSAYFDHIVTRVSGERSGDAFLVNGKGLYQTTPRGGGSLMGQSPLKELQPFAGVKVEEVEGLLQMMTWLERVPWVCVARFEQSQVYRPLYRMRNLGLGVFFAGGLLIVLTVLLSTSHLVSALERKRRSIRLLDHQLRQTSMIASTVNLASGFVREILDRLSNVDLVVKWIRELTQRDPIGERDRNEIRESLNQISSEVSLARRTTERFLKATRRTIPVIREIGIHEILDDILELLERELHFNRIVVERDYQDSPLRIRSDPSRLRQVFQNLILNAMSAVEKEGKITLTTRAGEGNVTITVTDSGPGISEDLMDKIFDPLFSTRPEGTGLGLSICVDILEKLGGEISVSSEPGRGSSFVVRLPLEFSPSGS